MAQVHGLRGIRYHAERAADLGRVLAPPYDVVDAAVRAELVQRHPANIIRVELPETLPGDGPLSRYERAAATLRAWLTDGTLRVDPRPAIYVHEHGFQHEGRAYRRRGLFAAVRLAAWSAGEVLPHEFTHAQPKADRLNLYRQARAQVSPLFGLYEDATGEIANVLDWTITATPVMDTSSPDGETHRFWVLDEPALLDELHDLFAVRPLFIADGHHRYETGLAYRDERLAADPAAAADAPYRHVLMCLSDVADPGLVVLPTHRLVVGPRPPAAHVEAALRQLFHVEPVAPGTSASALVAHLAEHGPGRAFGWVTAEQAAILTLKDDALADEFMPTERSAAWRGLDVARLHVLVLERALGIGADLAEERLLYTRDADEACARTRSGEAHAALLLNPTDLRGLLAVARAGDKMPQKSTYFYPKVPTGLVIHDLR